MIAVSDDWAGVDWGRPPLAHEVGPFPHRGFLEAWWTLRGTGELRLVESETALLPLRLTAGVVEFLGEPDLTDYHTPLGTDGGAAAAAFLGRLPAGSGFRFDSLPAEAALPLATGLEAAGYEAPARPSDVTAVVDLAPTFDDYLAELSTKQRHEIRRKTRRFEEAFGPARLQKDSSPESLRAFVEMHRVADGSKGSFMTPDMEGFFAALLELPEAVIHLLVGAGDDPIAAAFGFETAHAYYLYNSAFDPGSAHASPGIVLIERLLADAIGAGRSRFDFLKGGEGYKFRMGATPRRLYVVEGTT